MGTKKKNTKKVKTTTKNTHITHSYRGVLDIAKSGMGFVMVPELENDILDFPTDFNTALKGDEVSVKITKIRQGSGKKEGKVLEVIKRKQVSFAGVMQVTNKHAFFIPNTLHPMPDIYIPINTKATPVAKPTIAAQPIETPLEKPREPTEP